MSQMTKEAERTELHRTNIRGRGRHDENINDDGALLARAPIPALN